MKEVVIEEFVELISYYVENNKEADYNFVDKIIEIFVNYQNLNEYVKGCHFDNQMEKNLANYNFDSRIISVNPQVFFSFLKFFSSCYKFDEKDLKIFPYINVVKPVLHELIHSYQYKICDSDNNDIEAKILKLCFNYLYLELKLQNQKVPRIIQNLQLNQVENIYSVYDKYYLYAPHERLANIKSYQILKAVAQKLNLTGLYNYEDLEIQKIFLQAYDNCLNPTYFYLKKLGYKKEAKIIEQIGKNLSLKERITLGLKIKQLESNNLTIEKDSLKRKLYRDDLVA